MPVRVNIPIRIRVDPLALLERQGDLKDALVAAAGRALKNSRDVVLTQRGGYVEVQVHLPEFTWIGNDLADIPLSTQTETETWIAILLAQLTQVAEMYEFMRRAESAPAPLPKQIEEVIEQDRYEPLENFSSSTAKLSDREQGTDTYAIPSYQKEGKALIYLSVEGSWQPSAKLTKKLENEIQSMVERLNKDDGLFEILLFTTRTDGSQTNGDSIALHALRDFAKQNPKKFRKKIQQQLDGVSNEFFHKGIGALSTLLFTISDESTQNTALDIATDAVRVAKQIPEGRALLQDQESNAKELPRLLGLLAALIEIRQKLQSYLGKSSEKTSSPILESLAKSIIELTRMQGLFVALANNKETWKIVSDFEKDLIENYRWIANIFEKLQEIDVQISSYQSLYGDSSNKLDEVYVFRQAREGYLQQAAENCLPSTTAINILLKESNDFYKNWRGTVATRKVAKFKKAIEIIRQLIAEIESSSETITSVPISYAKFFMELPKLKQEVDRLIFEIENSWDQEEDGSFKSVKSALVEDLYPKFTNEIEQKIFVVHTKTMLFQVWNNCLQIEFLIREQKLGISISRDSTTQKRWLGDIESIRKEVEAQYAKTNLIELQGQAIIWQQKFKGLDNDIKSEEQIKLYIKGGITIIAGLAALFLTAGTSGGLVIVEIQEVLVFTVVSVVLESALLNKTITPYELAAEFSQNALMFGAFRILNKGILAGAKVLASGRPLAQFSIIMGSNALVATGFPLLIAKLQKTELLEDDKVPEGTYIQIISSLLLIAIAGVITGSKLVTEIKAQKNLLTEIKAQEARQNIISKLMNIKSEYKNWLTEMEPIIEKGGPNEGEHKAAKAQGEKIYTALKDVLSRMASKEFSDADLLQLGYDRTQIQEMAKLAADFAKGIANSPFVHPASTQKFLPLPNQVLNSLVPSSSGSYEYNPSSSTNQLNLITTRLKSAGYNVTDNGGGVLRLTAPKGEGPSYLLLPAAKPGEPTFGRTLLESAKRCNTPCFPPNATQEQIARIDRLLKRVSGSGEVDYDLLTRYFHAQREQLSSAINNLENVEKSFAKISAERINERTNQYLKKGSPTRVVSKEDVAAQVTRAYEHGEKQGRVLALREGLNESGFVNPFAHRGGYEQGIDDIRVHGSDLFRDDIYLVEYKGGGATLKPGQMEPDWAWKNIQRLRNEGGEPGRRWASILEQAAKDGRLKGRAYSSPLVKPTKRMHIDDWIYKFP